MAVKYISTKLLAQMNVCRPSHHRYPQSDCRGYFVLDSLGNYLMAYYDKAKVAFTNDCVPEAAVLYTM